MNIKGAFQTGRIRRLIWFCYLHSDSLHDFVMAESFQDFELKVSLKVLNFADYNGFSDLVSDLVSVYLKVFDHYIWKFQ